MSDEIEKVVVTGTGDALAGESAVNGGSGGLLNPDQANVFLDYMWNSSVLMNQVRKIPMRSDTLDVDKVAIGERIVRGATEAVDDGVNAGAVFTKISLTTKKFRLDYEISTESLEDNIEGAGLEDHLARLFAAQWANDLEDIAINGDVTETSEPGISQLDGWAKLLRTVAHVVDAGGAALDRAVLNSALKAMPRKYMQNRPALRFYTGSNLIQDFLYSETQLSSTDVRPENIAAQVINGPVVPEGAAGFATGRSFGVPVIEVPHFLNTKDGDYSGAAGDHGDVLLTFPQNLLVGVKREVEVYREFKPKKDTTEWTLYTRMGVQVQHGDAAVIVKNVKVQ